ncbi:hypothetical protein [Paenibacillus hamazuiensis]|uniref:hypothetical protein n=1 Tax=Paenibacillus hamazuiensis TaxID=2936508 RepID=UPI00200F0875|nr:hypothetical protein [Paenibacillus hamazuiensis]
MGKSLVIRSEASYSLNFLVYIQNIFLNRHRPNKQECRFPYILSKETDFAESFEDAFRRLWNEILHNLCEHPAHDLKLFYERKLLFYEKLFASNAEQLHTYNEIYQSFKVWWDSFAGRFALERSVSDQNRVLYRELSGAAIQAGIELRKEFSISLVYDEFPLGDAEGDSYFAVVPIGDYFVKDKQLVSHLLKYMY